MFVPRLRPCGVGLNGRALASSVFGERGALAIDKMAASLFVNFSAGAGLYSVTASLDWCSEVARLSLVVVASAARLFFLFNTTSRFVET